MADAVKNLFGKGGDKGQLFSGDFGDLRDPFQGTVLEGGALSSDGSNTKKSTEAQQAFRAKVLSRSFTALSAFGEIGEGFAKSAALKSEGRALDFQARQVSLQGVREAINESIRATQAVGSQVVAAPTSLTGSSAGAVLAEFEDSQTNINILRLNAEQRSLLARDAANKARRAAKRAKILGFVNAAKRVGTAFAGGGGF